MHSIMVRSLVLLMYFNPIWLWFTAYLDDIANLQDPELFFNKVASEVGARTPPKNGKRMPPALNKPDVVASTIATKWAIMAK